MSFSIKALTTKYSQMSTVAKATFCFLICSIFQKCISMLTTPIFTRLLSTEELGYFNTFLSWTQILTILTTLRLDFSVFYKGMERFSEQKNDYTATMQTISSALTLGIFLLYLPFHTYINHLTGLTTQITVLLFFEVFFYNSVSFWMLRQRYTYNYKAVIGVTIGLSFIQTIFGIAGVILTNYSSIGRIMAVILTNIGFGIAIYIYNYRKCNHIYVKEFAKFALIFNIPLLPHYFSSYILDQFDRIMIQHLVGYSAVGLYSLGYSCGYVIRIITSSLNNTLIPWIFQTLKKENYSGLRSCINSILHCVLICFMGYMTLAPEVIRIFAPSQYYEAVYTMVVVTASAFLIFVYELYSNMEFYFSENKFTMYIAIIGSVLNVILNYLCISRWGYIAAAYTTLFSYIYFCLSHFIYIRFVLKKNTGNTVFPFSDLFLKIGIMIFYTIFINFIIPHSTIRYCIVLALLCYTYLKREKLFAFITLLK